MAAAIARFELWCEETTVGQALLIVGSDSALGEWNPARGLRLSTSAPLPRSGGAAVSEGCVPFPVWRSAAVPLAPGRAVEYKYIIVSEKTGEVVRWEAGRNRKVLLESSEKSWVVRDQGFDEAEDPRVVEIGGEASQEKSSEVYICSFNVRYDSDKSDIEDGQDRWAFRREACCRLIRQRGFDLVGMQEPVPHQVDYFYKHLWRDGYAYLGCGRDASGAGEAAVIFYRVERFKAWHWQTFWLSGKPDEPGSKMCKPNACLPRSLTCCELELLGTGAVPAPRICMFNTHLDFLGIREKDFAVQCAQARVALQCMDKFIAGVDCGNGLFSYPSCLSVLTGDFNSPRSSPNSQTPYQLISAAGYSDCGARSDVPTFQGFDLKGGVCQANSSVDTIDYIFTAGHGFTISEYEALDEYYPQTLLTCREGMGDSITVRGGSASVIRAWLGEAKHVWSLEWGMDVTSAVKEMLDNGVRELRSDPLLFGGDPRAKLGKLPGAEDTRHQALKGVLLAVEVTKDSAMPRRYSDHLPIAARLKFERPKR